uniref:hypothetical protein n=1 Tax=Aliarcobacter sp. TaxID=2321116 RepID=UPI00404721E6
MKIIIINDSKTISIDGVSYSNLSFFIASNIHAVHFDTELNIGEIEFKDKPNSKIDNFNFSEYKRIFDIEHSKQSLPDFHIWDDIKQVSVYSPELENDKLKQDILSQLDFIDRKSIRAIREKNEELIQQYENEASVLRTELKLLK